VLQSTFWKVPSSTKFKINRPRQVHLGHDGTGLGSSKWMPEKVVVVPENGASDAGVFSTTTQPTCTFTHTAY
jgi:hypothetical protein